MALTAEQILAADDMGLMQVSVPEWGGDLHIRVMSVGERDTYERMWIGKKDSGVDNFRTEFLARVLCDDKGKLLFGREKVEALASKSGAVMGRLFDAAMKHNYMEADSVEASGKS